MTYKDVLIYLIERDLILDEDGVCPPDRIGLCKNANPDIIKCYKCWIDFINNRCANFESKVKYDIA